MSGNKYVYKVEDQQVKVKISKNTALCDLIYMMMTVSSSES